MSDRRLDPDSRTSRGRQSRQLRRGLVPDAHEPAKPLNPASAAPSDGSAYQFSEPAAEFPQTSLERALKIADFWRERCIDLIEENYRLKREVLEAVAEKLRVQVVVKEPEP